MKPSFALDFRDGAVALLHRSARGWTSVGQTRFDSPDLDEALAFLRSTAMGLSPGGVATKLIIPNDQILYVTLRAPGPDAAKRRKQIAAALEGLTPYPVSDLVFDWWGKGDEVNVAAIAKETLAEAESFAQAHRFNPLSFVAVPDNGIFQGEPWFGLTSVAPQVLAADEKVDRDQDPVRINGREPAAAAEPEVAPPEPAVRWTAEPAAEALAAPQPLPQAEPDMVPGAPPAPVETAAPPQEAFVADEAASRPVPEPMPEPQPELLPEPQKADWRDPRPKPEFAAEAVPVMTADPKVAEPVLAPAMAAIPIETDEAPMALDVDDDLPEPPVLSDPVPDQTFGASLTAGRPDREDEASGSGYGLLRAFTSRRKVPEPLASAKAEPRIAAVAPSVGFTSAAGPVDAAPPALAGRASVIDPDIARAPEPPRPTALESSGMAVIGEASERLRSAGAPPKMTAERPAMARPLPNGPGAKAAPGKASKGLKGFGAFVTSPNIQGAKRPRVNIPAQPQVAANPAGSKAMGAAPGARPIGIGGRAMPQRGKPRYLGLILTGILLVLLALVAAWASFFLAFNPDETATTNVAAVEQPLITDVPAPEDEMLADMQDPADFTEAEVAGQTGAGEVAALAEAPVAEAPLTEAVAPDPAAETAVLEPAPVTGLVSQTGAAEAAPAADPQDEIFLAAIDTAPQPPDPLALGAPSARTDALPTPAVPPPPFGTVFQFDADGRIIPTPEGITTLEGVLLVAGKPPIVPTSRTAAVEAAVAAAQTAAAVPVAGTVDGVVAEPVDGIGNPSTVLTDPAAVVEGAGDPAAAEGAPVFADPALQGLRPQARPAGLQGPVQNGSAEDPALAPQSDGRFASLRPQPRPVSIAPAPSPEVDEASIEAAIQTASLVTDGQVLAQAQSPLTVSVSRMPAARPKGLAAASQSAPVEEVAASTSDNGAVAPEADAEPEVDAPMPNLPTSASVAKQATVVDAINLSKMTLIGIYGTDGRRYALVRQANGRLVKVKVGDKLDGGKVAAINTSELIIQKGGRAISLEMPRT